MSLPTLDGPRLAPHSGGPAKQLIVFLHGYGADGHDLIGLGSQFAPHLPDAAFVSPHAPDPCDMSPSGRQWFPLTMRDPSEYGRGVVAARPALDAFLDKELSRLNLAASALALVGFSQGCMMALHVGLRRVSPPACLIGYSGLLANPDLLAQEITAKPPVLLAHGTADPVVPFQSMEIAEQALRQVDVAVQTHVAQGIGHGIDQQGLVLGLTHLRTHLGITDTP